MAWIVRLDECGGTEVLRIENAEIAAPAAGGPRVRIEAIGLNGMEAMVRAGI